MSKIVSNYTSNGSSTTDEYGTFIALHRFLQGDVIQGFTVVAAASPNMTVLVQPGSGRITTGTSPADYGYFISHDTSAGESVTIATAASSPRIDYIVAYVDKSVAGSTLPANVNNTNNVLKFAAVAGTPAGSPVVPTTAQIQAAIGAANPYIILAQVAVAASVSQITNTNITDKRTMVSPLRTGPALTTDANGWTIYDNGTWKEYEKSVAFTPGSVNSGTTTNISCGNAPVGVDMSLPGVFTTATVSADSSNGNAFVFPYRLHITAGVGGAIQLRMTNAYSAANNMGSCLATLKVRV